MPDQPEDYQKLQERVVQLETLLGIYKPPPITGEEQRKKQEERLGQRKRH